MPNWCSNTLWVEGNPEQMQEFISKSVKPLEDNPNYNVFTLEGLYPTPAELLNEAAFSGIADDATENEKFLHELKVKALEEKYGYTDWYNWRVNRWGTKWDVSDSWVDEHDGDALTINYTTAWGPNSMFIHYASIQFPNLRFKLSYEEPGMGFCGCYEVKNGGEDFEDLIEGDLEWIDSDTDRLVTFDSGLERYRYVDTNEVIDDEDFYPQEHNPFI